MARGTRRSDVKNRLAPRRLSWLAWFLGQSLRAGKWVLLAAVVVGVCALFWAQGYMSRVGAWGQDKLARATATSGVVVRDVTIEGRANTDMAALKAAIAVNPGDALLGVDIADIQTRLLEIPWIKTAQVRRVLPDRLIVQITERLPIAVWVDSPQGAVAIDDEGVILTAQDLGRFGTLLAVEGRDCEKAAAGLISLLKGQPDIAVRVVRAVRVSARRWDVVLDSKLVLRLPEDDPGFALARISKAQLEQKILDQGYIAIDLRQPDRLILEGKPVSPDATLSKDKQHG